MSAASSFWVASHRMRVQSSSVKTEKVKGLLFYYLLAIIFVVFACSLFYIWSRIQIVNLGYSINRQISLKEQLQEEQKRLSLEVASLKSPIRLEALAKNSLGMDLPQKSQVWSVQASVQAKDDLSLAKAEKTISEQSEKRIEPVVSSLASKKKKEEALKAKVIGQITKQKTNLKSLTQLPKKEIGVKKGKEAVKVSKDNKVDLKSKSISKNNTLKINNTKKTASNPKPPKIASIAGLPPHR